MRVPNLPRLNAAATASFALGVMAVALVARHLSQPWVLVAVGGAIVAGHLGRRPALRSRRPRVEDMRSLVVATAGMSLAVIAAVLLALRYVTQFVHH